MTDSPGRPNRRGQRITLWLLPDEAATLERLQLALASSTDANRRATAARVLKEGLDSLSLDVFDGHERLEPVKADRRASAGRRAYDKRRAEFREKLMRDVQEKLAEWRRARGSDREA